MKSIYSLIAALLLLGGCVGMEQDGLAIETSECKVRGLGTLDGDELFVGRMKGNSSQVHGRWIHWGARVCEQPGDPSCGEANEGEHLGPRDQFIGIPEALHCRLNGYGFATVDGQAIWNGQEGYTFRLFLQDLRGAQPDQYLLTVLDPKGGLAYFVSDQLATGEISVLPN